MKVSRAQSKVNEVNADMPIYYFVSLRKCLKGCERPLFPKMFSLSEHPQFLWRSLRPQAKSIKSMPIRQHTIPSVSENIYEAVNDHSSLPKYSVSKHPQFFRRSLGPQAKSMKSMPILFHQSQKISMKLWTTTIPKKTFSVSGHTQFWRSLGLKA